MQELPFFKTKENFTEQDNKLVQEIIDYFNREDMKLFLKYSEILDRHNNTYTELSKKSTFDYFKQKGSSLLIKDVLDKLV